MTETIKAIIMDFQETRLETGVPRRLYIETVQGKATVCIGVRRSGKTTYMFQIICEIYLTGSSARMLSKEIATQMRGRALMGDVPLLFPWIPGLQRNRDRGCLIYKEAILRAEGL